MAEIEIAVKPGLVPKIFELAPGSNMLILGRLADVMSSLAFINDAKVQAAARAAGMSTEVNERMRPYLEGGLEGQVDYVAMNLLAVTMVISIGKLGESLLGRVSDDELERILPQLSADEVRQIPNKMMGLTGLTWLALGAFNGLQHFLFHVNPEMLEKLTELVF